MKTDRHDRTTTPSADLRCTAEMRLHAGSAILQPSRTMEETQKLLHELEVHQIELEMQNMELRQARDEADAALKKYTDLFNYAPVGYFTHEDPQSPEDLRRKDQMMILQDRRAVMGEMINNIAHQWRQPLNTLGLLVQLLPLQHASGELDGKLLEETAQKCMELIEHMSQTIEDFKNFYRADKKAVPFSVNQLTGYTLSLIEKTLYDRQITTVHQAEVDPIITGYPNEYAQVLLNILTNACDALFIRAIDDARIWIHTFVEAGKTVVTISDNAGGIDSDIVDRIFEPYFTTKGPENGTGIGLFMSKTIIEKNMGGSLTVHNTGNGAMFRIEV